MKAFVTFMTGILKMPLGVKAWLGILMVANAVAPIFFIELLEAQIVVATFAASFVLMVMITAKAGFVRLLGLGHILWIPLIVFLLFRLNHHPLTVAYSTWMWLVIGLNAISLIIDAIDVVRYLRSNRAEMVSFE